MAEIVQARSKSVLDHENPIHRKQATHNVWPVLLHFSVDLDADGRN